MGALSKEVCCTNWCHFIVSNSSFNCPWSKKTVCFYPNFFLKMLPWVWAPITAVMYLLGPSAVAQTKLIFSNRMRKAHVSPKSVPTPASTPRPGATPTPMRSERESVDHSPSAPLTPMHGGLESFRPIKLVLPSFSQGSSGSGPNSRREA